MAGVGVVWAMAGTAHLEPLADWVGAALGVSVSEFVRFSRFTDGIAGASFAGKWVASLGLLAGPIAQRRRWGVEVLVLAHAASLLVSAVASGWTGHAGLWLVDGATFLFVAAIGRTLLRHSRPVRRELPRTRWSYALVGVLAFSITTGIVSAFALGTAPFAFYREAMEATFFAGATLPHDAAVWFDASCGLIGAAIVGHFVALTGAAWFAPDERATWINIAVSMSTWFVVDTAQCAVQGAWFNIALVNVPSFGGTMVMLAITAWRSRRAEAEP